ncbi:AMP-binding protein [Pseudoxanthomonas wuyuanensis]|uniref:Long-chain acyl-CoA synthetase (AMP-forming) n=1 Tax=Pseudoxanthomonas wuyuanensis TaxID=1073196 RepID=A0A286D6E1_9GAMM|nr:AMP-binding protein [Pseudoxanthomonas wuyuanensis]KAF1721517.1 long-chain acyl-CoA synthetase [Pseudoxanthomonas wuyuanensis]SOD54197.1 Long-chain acyl-CoA synthetase (AMP-forming) [Pseudoxanthomonas wuyuanensis]
MGFASLIEGLTGTAVRVLCADGAISDGELGERVRRVAQRIADSGEQCVASRLDNGPDWLVLDLAIRQLGAVHVPLPTFFTPAQVMHALTSSGAGLLVQPVGAALPEGIPAAEPVALEGSLAMAQLSLAPVALPAGTACITFTSGTTGSPKGVCLDAAALFAVAESLSEAARPLAPRRHLCLMPLSTLLENVAGVYSALIAGAEIAVPPLAEVGYSGASGLDIPTLLACLHRYRPESAILLPQLLLALVMAAEQGAVLPVSLRFLAVGGGRVGPALMTRASALGLPVYEGYGLSECASVVCLNRPGASRPGSVGRPLPHARVSVIDGELWVEGVRCLGYLGGEDLPPGPIATGDLGEIDEDGFIHITGRRKNVFITAFGRNVSPEWVESELLQHPAFAQAVVHGEARPFNIAVLWPRQPGAADEQLQQALAEVNQGLPDYAQVRRFVRAEVPFSFADGLLTSNGRPRRAAVLARYGDAIEQCYRSATFPSPQGISA